MCKFDIYEEVTKRIIDQMEQGIIPWCKSWHGSRTGAYSLTTGKAYSMCNQMLLMHDGAYATFNEITKRGGKVNKGAKSEIVVFWKMVKTTELKDGVKEEKVIPMLRYYNVFHVETQTAGINIKDSLNENILADKDAENIIDNYVSRETLSIISNEVTNDAYYSPSQDYIKVPTISQYDNNNEYYSTLFHEMIHSTGHKSRLNRDTLTKMVAFGDKEYSKEELVAEIGSCGLLKMCNLETMNTFRNNVAYLQSWISVLKNDKKFIISASSKADKAIEYILNGCAN